MIRFQNEDVDLGDGAIQLAWNEDYCYSAMSRAVRLNGPYRVGGDIEDYAATIINPGAVGTVVSVWVPDSEKLPNQFAVKWARHRDPLYVDASCVTVLADLPDDLSDTNAVEQWLTAS